MLAGKFAMAFVYCSLAWLDVSIFIFLHLCAEGIAEKVRTALVIDLYLFCACCLFFGRMSRNYYEPLCEIFMFCTHVFSTYSTYRISACAEF